MADGHMSEMRFHAEGAEDWARRFAVEVLPTLPQGHAAGWRCRSIWPS
jgi:hypothetical protein